MKSLQNNLFMPSAQASNMSPLASPATLRRAMQAKTEDLSVKLPFEAALANKAKNDKVIERPKDMRKEPLSNPGPKTKFGQDAENEVQVSAKQIKKPSQPNKPAESKLEKPEDSTKENELESSDETKEKSAQEPVLFLLKDMVQTLQLQELQAVDTNATELQTVSELNGVTSSSSNYEATKVGSESLDSFTGVFINESAIEETVVNTIVPQEGIQETPAVLGDNQIPHLQMTESKALSGSEIETKANDLLSTDIVEGGSTPEAIVAKEAGANPELLAKKVDLQAAKEFVQALEAYGVEVVSVSVKGPQVSLNSSSESLDPVASTESTDVLTEDLEGLQTFELADASKNTDQGQTDDHGKQGRRFETQKDVKAITGHALENKLQGNGFTSVLDQASSEITTITHDKSKLPHSPAAILDQIKEAMGKQAVLASEKTEMIIKLKPEELGKVELKIEVHNDTVVAKFDVASQMVKETIESSLNDLKNALKDKGFSDMTFDVNVNREKTQDHRGDSRGHKGRGRRQGIERESVTVVRQQVQYQKSLAVLVGNSQFEHFA